MDKGMIFRRYFLHPLFSLVIPLFLVFSILPLYAANVPEMTPGILQYFLLILAIVVQVATSTFFESVRFNNKEKAFEICAVLATGFLVHWTFGELVEVAFTEAVFYGCFWYISFSIHRGLKALEIVETSLRQCKAANPTEYLKLQSQMMGDYNGAIKRNQSLFIFLFGLQLTLMIIVFFIPLKYNPVFPVLSVSFQILVLCAFFYLNLTRTDTIYLSEGLGFQGGRRKKQIYAIGVLLVFIMAVSVPFAVFGPLLPMSLLDMSRFNITGEETPPEVEALPTLEPSDQMAMPESFGELSKQSEPLFDLIPVLYVIGCVVGAFVVFSAVYRFLIFWRPIRRLKRFFSKGWFSRLLAFFTELKNSFLVDKEQRIVSKEKGGEEKVKRTKERKKLIADYRKAFFYIVKWGEKNGCRHSSDMTIREYALIISSRIPEAKTDLDNFCGIVYEDCFSGFTPSNERKKKILILVKSILRKKAA